MSKSANLHIGKHVSHQEVFLFTKHLATMIKAGIPLVEAVDNLADQTKNSYFKSVLYSVRDSIENGQSLSVSLSKYPRIFDNFYISIIAVSEESGTLDENLFFLSSQLSKDFQLRRKIKGALMYPLIIIVSALVMGGFIAFFVLPRLIDFFDAFEVELPTSTKILLAIANTTKNYGLVIVFLCIILVVILRIFVRTKAVKPIWHKLLLAIPFVGDLLVSGQLARFSRNMGVLLSSGVPISKALEITARTMSNVVFERKLKELSKSLSKGNALAKTLASGRYKEFPPLVYKMIDVGEKTGTLDETLLYISDFYEDEIDTVSKNLTTVLEPVLLLLIGLGVGFVALAIISPIYELTGSIRR